MDNTLIIDKSALERAKNICNAIESSEERCHAVANTFAAKLAKDYFSDIDTDSGLHNVPMLLTGLEIADIYVKDLRIEVRLVHEGASLTVPKIHYDKGILPFAYMFIKVDNNISQAELLGFGLVSNINFLDEVSEFYNINEDSLLNLSDFNLYLNESVIEESETEISEQLSLVLFDYVDGRLDDKEVISLLRILFENKTARLKLIDIMNTNSIFNYLSTDISANNINNEAGNNENIETLDLEAILEKDFSQQLSDENVIQENNFENDESDFSKSNQEEIEGLFVDNSDSASTIDTDFSNSNKTKKQFKLFPFILFALILGGVGFGVYSKFFVSSENLIDESKNVQKVNQNQKVVNQKLSQEIQMPIETIENEKKVEVVVQNNLPKEVASVSIPTLEQNLGASISISNLKVSWDVPSNYLSNIAVQKYFIKIGKIIQLNLKTELMLQVKQPVSNKINVELEFDKKINKFKVKNIINSSGEKSIDDIIIQIINNALLIDLKFNMNMFNEISDNPVLTINL